MYILMNIRVSIRGQQYSVPVHTFFLPCLDYVLHYFLKQAKELLNKNDIYNIDWNCLSGDAETNNPTPEYIMKRIQETSHGKNSLIV